MRHNIFLLLGCLFCQSLWSQINLQEKEFAIPTYRQEVPNPMPRFYEGKSHQGVQRRIYPYPYDDGLTPDKQVQNHKMVHIENEFIDLAISPQLGGRIYYADDKTNNYNYLYHNHVVKPSLIGMIGNWVSGSLAWGYPHHHGPNTVESMGYKIEEKSDGTKTVWIRSWDRRHRMEAVVGYTIYPNSSIIEMTIHPKNRTALSNSFLFWTNPAVHCDSAYQVIFPPSVKFVTFHGKNQMTSWPIADSRFNNYDFTGMDISWWKNTHVPSSFFSWDPREDYFCGYDHNKQAGTAWVGNHYISPGMKYWADGNNANGLKTNEELTDNDGRYIELMAGFYTDNQPDYSWLQPYETKIGKMIWFPIRELGGLKYANRQGALNYTIEHRRFSLFLNATSPHSKARVVVTAKGKELLNQVISIGPAEPRNFSCELPNDVLENDLNMTLYNETNEMLLSYRPVEHVAPTYDKPEAMKPFPQPAQIKTVEELYLAGLRLDQFYNASVDPMPYYHEALRRDSGNYQVNLQLGIKSIKAYNWKAAEKHLRVAVARITSNYTRPKDGEALYYLGICLRALGQDEEAYDCLYRASWSSAWHTASYFQLAEMDCLRNDFSTALEHVQLSISTNTDNMRAQNLKAYLLRQLHRVDEAQLLLGNNLDTCKIDHMALNELLINQRVKGGVAAAQTSLNELERLMLNDVQAYLELATEYAQFGAYKDAIEVLMRMEQKGEIFPMLYYALGYYHSQANQPDKALAYYKKASTLPADYCYPFRLEEICMLKQAMELNPMDARAPYYLGNLLYEHQPREAIAWWEKALTLDPSFYITYRNLALACKEIRKDYPQALEYMQKAVACNKKDARLLFELDDLNVRNKRSPKETYDFLKKNMEVVRTRPEVLLCLATRAVAYGKYEEALQLMDTNFIIESEGARDKQDNYLNSYVILAMNLADKGQYEKALARINQALNYPIGLYGRSKYAQLYYVVGTIYQKKGDNAQATDFFQKAVDVTTDHRSDNECIYYQAMAQLALHRPEQGKQLLQRILDSLDQSNDAFFTQFEGGDLDDDKRIATNHYYRGLAHEGLGEMKIAKAEYEKALVHHPSHVWSRVHLNALK